MNKSKRNSLKLLFSSFFGTILLALNDITIQSTYKRLRKKKFKNYIWYLNEGD
jgi:hypothetical protein